MAQHITIDDDTPCGSITSNDLKPNEEQLEDLSFDLSIVLDGFKKCKKDDQIHIEDYLRAYAELNKFFQLLGNIFNFIANDVQKKITILQCYCKGGAGDYYYSIHSMIEYEKDNNLLHNSSEVSGSRTLLRLHRALNFITGFLDNLGKAKDEESLNTMTCDVYNRTLAKYHGWVLSKTVNAILYFMPTKKTIIDKITKGDFQLRVHNEALLPQVIEVMTEVYNQTQKLYEDYDILKLP